MRFILITGRRAALLLAILPYILYLTARPHAVLPAAAGPAANGFRERLLQLMFDFFSRGF